MRNAVSTYSIKHSVYSVFMLVVLGWLTVSIPFVYADQQKKAPNKAAQKHKQSAKDILNSPISNSTEEKTESGVNTISEFLHDAECIIPDVQNDDCARQGYNVQIYVAYHIELLSPPPEG